MKCPVCGIKINVLDNKCPNCKTDLEQYEKNKSSNNAKYLGIFANINLIISIIASIYVWFNYSIIIIEKKSDILIKTTSETIINWFGILGGFGILISGLTLYFLLKTVIDIYNRR